MRHKIQLLQYKLNDGLTDKYLVRVSYGKDVATSLGLLPGDLREEELDHLGSFVIGLLEGARLIRIRPLDKPKKKSGSAKKKGKATK